MPFLIPDKLADFVKRLPEVYQWIKNFRVTGPGVTFQNTPQGATITITQPQQKAQAGSSSFLIRCLRVNNRLQFGANRAWWYAVHEVRKIAAGPGASIGTGAVWETVSGGVISTGTPTTGGDNWAVNPNEWINSSDIHYNGLDADNVSDAGFEITAIGVGAVVWATPVVIDGKTEWQILNWSNQIDGNCL